MSIRTFWLIFLKILGLRLISHAAGVISVTNMYATTEYGQGNVGEAVLMGVSILSFYLLMMFTLIFKTNWIINLLRLDKGFDEDRISLDISSNTVLTMAIIVLGGIMIIEVLPDFLIDIANFFNGDIFRDTSRFATNLIRAILGLLLMAQHKPIVAFITKKANE